MRTFSARFDSTCDHCGGVIDEGDEIAYIDDKIACENCVNDEDDYEWDN